MRQQVRVFAAVAFSPPTPSVVASSPGMLWIRTFSCAVLALVLFTPTSRGGLIITFSQVGANVEAQGVGSLDLSALKFNGITGALTPYVTPVQGALQIGKPQSPFTTGEYDGAIGPTSLGTGPLAVASTSAGTSVGIVPFPGPEALLLLPPQYTSGNPLTASATWDNTTISGLGLTPGTYTWTWGSGATADFLEVDIPSVAVPEPSSMILAGMAIGVTSFYIGIRRWRVAAAA
jgi:hypothetical protein